MLDSTGLGEEKLKIRAVADYFYEVYLLLSIISTAPLLYGKLRGIEHLPIR